VSWGRQQGSVVIAPDAVSEAFHVKAVELAIFIVLLVFVIVAILLGIGVLLL